METKVCKDCKKTKPITDYYFNKAYGRVNACKVCFKAQRLAHYHKTRDRYAAFYQENRERLIAGVREYQRKHPECMRDVMRRRRARKAQARGEFTSAQFKKLTKSYDNKCYYCTQALVEGNIHADHFIPLSKGGDNTINNIVPACQKCNNKKHAKMPWVFKEGEQYSPKPPELWKLDNFGKIW